MYYKTDPLIIVAKVHTQLALKATHHTHTHTMEETINLTLVPSTHIIIIYKLIYWLTLAIIMSSKLPNNKTTNCCVQYTSDIIFTGRFVWVFKVLHIFFFYETLSGFTILWPTRVWSKLLKACRVRSPGTSGFTSHPSWCSDNSFFQGKAEWTP